MEFLKDKQVQVKAGPAAGLRVKMIRKSRKTANITVEAVEDREAFRVGTRLHVQAYELSEIESRPHELVEDYEADVEAVKRSLARMVSHALSDRQKIIERLNSTEVAVVARMAEWGTGVKTDLMGSWAAQVLINADQLGSIEWALAEALEHLEYQMRTNQDSGGSSSAYHNAVDEDRRAARREAYDFCRRELYAIRKSRSLIEVL